MKPFYIKIRKVKVYYIKIVKTNSGNVVAELYNAYTNNRVDFRLGKTEEEAIDKLKQGEYGNFIDANTIIFR